MVSGASCLHRMLAFHDKPKRVTLSYRRRDLHVVDVTLSRLRGISRLHMWHLKGLIRAAESRYV